MAALGVRCSAVASAAAARVVEEPRAPAARPAACKPAGPTCVVRGRAAAGARLVARAAVLSDRPGADPRYAEFAKALEKYDFTFRVGDKISGIVIMVENSGIYVDIGAKSAAFCPSAECAMGKTSRVSDIAKVGERMEFIITKDDSDTKDQIVLLSLRRIALEAAWSRIAASQAKDSVYECKVVGLNRGGLLVEVEGIRGFLPTSHLTLRGEKLEDMMGKVLRAKVLESDPEGGRLVMSNRKAGGESERKVFNVGDVLVGTVQSVQPYGAFVDVAGASGLLHISQISQERVTTVEGVLAVGDKIKVMVLAQEKDKGKLSLTTKKLEPSPGDMLRNPKRVFDRAEEMAATFRQRVAVAEAAAAADDA